MLEILSQRLLRICLPHTHIIIIILAQVQLLCTYRPIVTSTTASYRIQSIPLETTSAHSFVDNYTANLMIAALIVNYVLGILGQYKPHFVWLVTACSDVSESLGSVQWLSYRCEWGLRYRSKHAGTQDTEIQHTAYCPTLSWMQENCSPCHRPETYKYLPINPWPLMVQELIEAVTPQAPLAPLVHKFSLDVKECLTLFELVVDYNH